MDLSILRQLNADRRDRRAAVLATDLDDGSSRLIHDGADEDRLRAQARAAGMRSLHEDGLRHVASGLTSAAELQRVIRA